VRVPLAALLLAATLALASWSEARTCRAAPRPIDAAARRIERSVTAATVLQLAASIALPVLLTQLGRPDLAVAAVSVTIGVLLLWLWARLRTAGHLLAGALLVIVPAALALFLSGDALTAASGLAVAAILTASALVGVRFLTTGEGSSW
jgi:hypothetical protein